MKQRTVLLTLGRLPQALDLARGFARGDLFTVVLEHFRTDTADHADYVLPATYIAGSNITVTVHSKYTGTGTAGTATLTDQQAADLMAGRWYANVHTAQNPTGEIRGQMLHE